MQHRYTLEPYKGRASCFLCPNCQHKRRTFKRYIDTETNTYLADHVGKCDRVDNCGYHYKPRQYFANDPTSRPMYHEPPTNRFDVLPHQLVDASAKAYHRNNFIAFLTKCFDEATALRLAKLYKIGTSKHWPGATIFWQIDVNENVRTGKIMLYNPADGHRVKQPYNHITWAHILSQKLKVESQKPDFKLNQCFFGEHLLNTHPFKIVAIAESEKTAIICNFIYPEYIWLASGSLDGLSLQKCMVLKEREVLLFPDLNGIDKWKKRAKELNGQLPLATFAVDKTLDNTATPGERAGGLDMADRWIEQILK